jgi:hypothetical protein
MPLGSPLVPMVPMPGQVTITPAAPSAGPSSAGGAASSRLGNAVRASISLIALIVGFSLVLYVTNEGPRECYPAPMDAGASTPRGQNLDQSAYFYGYTGAAIAIAGGCLGTAYGAGASGSVVGAIFALPLAIWPFMMATIILGAIPNGEEGYCPKVGYAHYSAGVMTGFGGVAGGVVIGMTQVIRLEGNDSCTALQNIACCARNLMAIIAGIVGNLLAILGLMCGLIASGATCS